MSPRGGIAARMRLSLQLTLSLAAIAVSLAWIWPHFALDTAERSTGTRPVPNVAIELAGTPTLGAAGAPVVLVVFSDFQCPYCSEFAVDTFPAVRAAFVDTGKVQVVFKHFPLDRIHPDARRASIATECARTQGRFWPMHDRVFRSPRQLSERALDAHAEAIKLDLATFRSCLLDQSAAEAVDRDVADGSRLGVSGTPTFFLGRLSDDRRAVLTSALHGAGPAASFARAIDQVLRASAEPR